MRYVFLCVCIACATPPDEPPPSAFRLDGIAEAMEGADGVSCIFFGDVTEVVETEDGWDGQMFGEVFRRSLDAAGSPVFEFQALLGGEVSMRGAEAHLFGEQDPSAMPFWRELVALEAEETEPYSYRGEWTCAPILPDDGPEGDSALSAVGTWTLAPIAGE